MNKVNSKKTLTQFAKAINNKNFKITLSKKKRKKKKKNCDLKIVFSVMFCTRYLFNET